MNKVIDLLVVGGGAAGFFTALNFALHLKSSKSGSPKIIILEQGSQLLKKVKISGGGRCNVTHSCFEPHQLVKFYPRGQKELLSPFFKFSPQDTIKWFKKQGILLKAEEDGRMFPISNNSQTIIDCFLKLTKKFKIKILIKQSVYSFKPLIQSNDLWEVKTKDQSFITKKLILATGGTSLAILKQLNNLGLSTSSPIPSLFTFNTKDRRLSGLSGISVNSVVIKLIDSPVKSKLKIAETGSMLITHRGLSEPAILRMSATAAKVIFQMNYKFSISIDWCNQVQIDDILQEFSTLRKHSPNKKIIHSRLYDIPKNLWTSIVLYSSIETETTWSTISLKQRQQLSTELKNSEFMITGKSTNKEEFVSCGGLDLKEVDFSNFSVKKFKNLHVVGELLNVDALTGGFNFQAAWTGGYLASLAD